MWTAEISTVLLASVLGQADVACVSGEKHVRPKYSASRSECCSLRDHTRPLRWSLAQAMGVTGLAPIDQIQ